MRDVIPAGARPGDFILTPTYGDHLARLIGWAIRFGTNAPVNHAAIFDGEQLVEAAPGGVRRVPVDSYNPAKVVWSTGLLGRGPTDLERQVIVDTALDMARRRVGYGFADIACIAIAQRRVGRVINPATPLAAQPWPWKQILRRVESLDTLICSQLVDLCYSEAWYHLFNDGRIPGLVSPGDLWVRLGRPRLGLR